MPLRNALPLAPRQEISLPVRTSASIRSSRWVAPSYPLESTAALLVTAAGRHSNRFFWGDQIEPGYSSADWRSCKLTTGIAVGAMTAAKGLSPTALINTAGEVTEEAFMEESVIKEFLRQMAIYFCGLCIAFLFFAVLFPSVINMIAWVSTKHLKSWGEMLDSSLWIVGRGLVIAPSVAFIFTLVDYGKFRGWSETRTVTVVAVDTADARRRCGVL